MDTIIWGAKLLKLNAEVAEKICFWERAGAEDGAAGARAGLHIDHFEKPQD